MQPATIVTDEPKQLIRIDDQPNSWGDHKYPFYCHLSRLQFDWVFVDLVVSLVTCNRRRQFFPPFHSSRCRRSLINDNRTNRTNHLMRCHFSFVFFFSAGCEMRQTILSFDSNQRAKHFHFDFAFYRASFRLIFRVLLVESRSSRSTNAPIFCSIFCHSESDLWRCRTFLAIAFVRFYFFPLKWPVAVDTIVR